MTSLAKGGEIPNIPHSKNKDDWRGAGL
jgi:hypothetical protein